MTVQNSMSILELDLRISIMKERYQEKKLCLDIGVRDTLLVAGNVIKEIIPGLVLI
jgi:hypothetical protein